MASSYRRTLPFIDDENRQFWLGGADGRLHINRCQQCRYWIHPPAPVCRNCMSDDVAVESPSGDAIVDTFTVNYKQWGAGMTIPYTIAIVELVEQAGLRLTTNITGIDPEKVTIGLPVEVTFEQDDDVWLPMFRPKQS